MTKIEAIELFGRTQADMARALGLTPQAIGQWRPILTQAQADRVMGAAARLAKKRRRAELRGAENVSNA